MSSSSRKVGVKRKISKFMTKLWGMEYVGWISLVTNVMSRLFGIISIKNETSYDQLEGEVCNKM